MNTEQMQPVETIQCLTRAYHDTNDERWALIAEGAYLTKVKEQLPAPCRGKIGQGIWAVGFCENSRKSVTVFMETESYVLLNSNIKTRNPNPPQS